MDVDPEQFAEKVVRYLPEDIREDLIARWDDMRTEVAYGIRAIREASHAVISVDANQEDGP